MYIELILIVKKYLPNNDQQAELTLLYCDNYTHTIIKKINSD